MAQRIYRFSPHRNGLVFGILAAIVTLVFLVPMFLIVSLTSPQQPGGGDAFPIWLLAAMPVFYFVFAYLMTAFWCWIYNVIFSRSGGIEFVLREESSDQV